MPDVAPISLIVGSLTIYTAAANTSRPAQVITAPAGSWTLLGSAGVGDQAEGGVKMVHSPNMGYWRGEGTAPRKAYLIEEDTTFEVGIAEVTAANLAMALGGQAITTVNASSGVPGSKAFDLYRGPGSITPIALLMRGSSPEFLGGTLEIYVPYAINENALDTTFSKGNPALIPFKFRAIESPAGGASRCGSVRVQTAAAS